MIVGIDPGAAGAIAWLTDDGQMVRVEDLPIAHIQAGKKIRRRLLPTVLAEMLRNDRPVAAYVEQVGVRPGEGSVGAFSLGTNAGQIEGVLAGLRIPYTLIRPQIWKKHFALTQDKELSRERALRLWPHHAGRFQFKKNSDRAEAALIALYGSAVAMESAA